MSKLATIKIKDENFLSRKQEVLTAIRGYGLGGAIIPPRFISDNSGVQIYNPTYVAHQRQEQLLSSWLLSSISSTLLPRFVGHDSARGIWQAVDQLFAAQSTTRVMNYKFKLQALKKGSCQ